MALARLIPQPRVTPAPPRSLLAIGLLGLIAACSSTRPPPPRQNPVALSTNGPAKDRIGSGSSFTTYASPRFNLSFALPDGASFRVDDRTERWLVATHEPTLSTLLVRAWREYDLVTRDQCEERARLARTLPERDGGVVIEERRIDVPPGHDTIVDVRVHARTAKSRPRGSVLAFGAWAHECFAFVFTTQDDDERIVAARLSTITSATLSRMRFENDLVPKRQPKSFTNR